MAAVQSVESPSSQYKSYVHLRWCATGASSGPQADGRSAVVGAFKLLYVA